MLVFGSVDHAAEFDQTVDLTCLAPRSWMKIGPRLVVLMARGRQQQQEQKYEQQYRQAQVETTLDDRLGAGRRAPSAAREVHSGPHGNRGR